MHVLFLCSTIPRAPNDSTVLGDREGSKYVYVCTKKKDQSETETYTQKNLIPPPWVSWEPRTFPLSSRDPVPDRCNFFSYPCQNFASIQKVTEKNTDKKIIIY